MEEKELCKTVQKPKKCVKYEQKFKIEYREEFCTCKWTWSAFLIFIMPFDS